MRPKNFKKCMKLYWNVQRGGELLGKFPSVGEVHVWIFSGTAHCIITDDFLTTEWLGGKGEGEREDYA